MHVTNEYTMKWLTYRIRNYDIKSDMDRAVVFYGDDEYKQNGIFQTSAIPQTDRFVLY